VAFTTRSPFLIGGFALLLVVAACSGAREEGDPAESRTSRSAASGTSDARALRGPLPARPVGALPDFRPLDKPGRWREYRTHRYDADLTEEQREKIEQLESISYVSGSRRIDAKGGVSVYDRQRAEPGYNFYTSGHAAEAILTDMTGRELHRWGYDFWKLWPDYPVGADHGGTQYWRRARLFPNGDILAIYDYLGIVKLDKDSSLIWANPLRAHHDLDVTPDGDIYVLAAVANVLPEVNETEPVLEDFVVILGPDGVEKKRVSVVDAVRRSGSPVLWEATRKRTGDIYHTNTLEVLDGSIAAEEPMFARGNVLLYLLHLNTIAVLDVEQEKIVWARTFAGAHRHDPKILPDGNMMIFVNFEASPRSKVIEFQSISDSIAWQYAGSDSRPFYSNSCGAAQRLADGNTLITESDQGRAFEVSPEGEIVWQFYNPHRAGDDGEYIATLFELIRLPADTPVDWASSPPR